MKLGELLDGQRKRIERWGRPPGRFREFYGFVAYSDMDFHRANVAPSRAHDAAGNPTNVPYGKKLDPIVKSMQAHENFVPQRRATEHSRYYR
jgi:hypothetical protein